MKIIKTIFKFPKECQRVLYRTENGVYHREDGPAHDMNHIDGTCVE